LGGVKPALNSACARRRGRQKQISIFRIFQIQLAEERPALIRTHSEIVRPAKSGHLSFYAKEDDLLWLRRYLADLFDRFRAF